MSNLQATLQPSPILNSHILGLPRIGAKRELKFALEAYWNGRIDQAALQQQATQIQLDNLQAQVVANLSILTVGDFVYYDAILSHSVRLGILPARFTQAQNLDPLQQQFYLARGRTNGCEDVAALQMTKWFDSNYHYLVPELRPEQTFTPDFSDLLAQVKLAQSFARPIKVVVPGLLTFLYLSRVVGTDSAQTPSTLAPCTHDQACLHSTQQPKTDNDAATSTLKFIDALLPIYAQLFSDLAALGVNYVQVDEPILVLDLAPEWQAAFERVYHLLQRRDGLKLILTTYFETLGNNLNLAVNLPVAGLHIDVCREKSGDFFWKKVIDQLPAHKILSLGVVDGRSVWAADQTKLQGILAHAHSQLGERLWVGSSCSLLHVPVDVEAEQLPPELHGKLAFAKQKLSEVAQLAHIRQQNDEQHQTAALHENNTLTTPSPTHDIQPQRRPHGFTERFAVQQRKLNLPLFPTTTIGSFPQTSEIRAARSAWKQQKLSDADYELAMQQAIGNAIHQQECLGLDVLVHGEAERTDMVEYFAEQLDGFWLSHFGWVQSYGSRCVRPPIIVADVSRPQAMTVKWIQYANSLTEKHVKGMLTGPVTILNWSFPPAHRSRREVCLQIAEAIRLEVNDLQNAGIEIIQIDEAAFREGLPLRKQDQAEYWSWAVAAFQHCASSARMDTQIHTHMCYSEFSDCLPQITAMDADVITIETSRSGLQLLDAFEQQAYPNAIGPGVYDIHSPRTPNWQSMQTVMDTALRSIPAERLWINPDCGLKTRNWPETLSALAQMVHLALQLRARHQAAA